MIKFVMTIASLLMCGTIGECPGQ